MTALDEELVVVARSTTLEPPLDRGTERVAHLRAVTLAALAEAAAARGAKLGPLEKDERDAPRPSGGWHWSISHTSQGALGLAVASVSRSPVGVDAEVVGRGRPELALHVLTPAERALLATLDEAAAFARAWTAKEAVLKKLGLGLMALSELRLEDAAGDQGVLLRGDTRHAVEWLSVPPFVLAVAGQARERVDWRVDPRLRTGEHEERRRGRSRS